MMVDRSVRVAIRFDDGRAQQQCVGPSSDALCPLADQRAVVACAGGAILALRGTVADGHRMIVGRGVGPRCPLARAGSSRSRTVGLTPAGVPVSGLGASSPRDDLPPPLRWRR